MSALNLTHVQVAHALMSWACNTSAIKKAEELFPGAHPSYIAEKAGLAVLGLPHLFGALDTENQARLVEIAIARYGAEAQKVHP